MGIRALTFDVIGTLFDWFGTFSDGVPPLAEKYGLTIDPGAFAIEACEGYARRVALANSENRWTPPDTILRDSIADLLSRDRRPSFAEVDDFFAIWRTLEPWADVPSALWALRENFTLAILSNMSIATQSALIAHSDLPFNRTLSAETVQAYKPNAAVYQMAIASLGLCPNEIVMISAHWLALIAAQRRGMMTAFVARPL
ncbi:MAG TPA: haloacid dehalogenase type II, partial [Solirubrobacteraceae bacterium]|nr:haloacid dehalogenase type II [Solirubrobacteraceae bacterium]